MEPEDLPRQRRHDMCALIRLREIKCTGRDAGRGLDLLEQEREGAGEVDLKCAREMLGKGVVSDGGERQGVLLRVRSGFKSRQ